MALQECEPAVQSVVDEPVRLVVLPVLVELLVVALPFVALPFVVLLFLQPPVVLPFVVLPVAAGRLLFVLFAPSSVDGCLQVVLPSAKRL